MSRQTFIQLQYFFLIMCLSFDFCRHGCWYINLLPTHWLIWVDFLLNFIHFNWIPNTVCIKWRVSLSVHLKTRFSVGWTIFSCLKWLLRGKQTTQPCAISCPLEVRIWSVWYKWWISHVFAKKVKGKNIDWFAELKPGEITCVISPPTEISRDRQKMLE